MHHTDLQTIWFALQIIQILISAVIGVYVWISNKSKAHKDSITKVDERVTGVAERVTSLETALKNIPDHDDLGEIHEKVNKQGNVLSEIKGELSALNRNFMMLFQDRLDKG